jgi:hypothetical protein
VVPASDVIMKGTSSFWPNTVVASSGFAPSWSVRMLSRTRERAAMLFRNELPLPIPPIPGTSPEQATPSHSEHTRHLPSSRSRARSITSASFFAEDAAGFAGALAAEVFTAWAGSGSAAIAVRARAAAPTPAAVAVAVRRKCLRSIDFSSFMTRFLSRA